MAPNGFCMDFLIKMLNDPLHNPYDKVHYFGFAIRRVTASQWHVGMLYKFGAAEARLRHQCSHDYLRDEEAKGHECHFLWVDIAALDDINKKLIAGKLTKAGGDKIPYGIGFQEGGSYIDNETLRYINTNPGMGLTCASYILAVLASLGFRPLDIEHWKSTEADIAWQTSILLAVGIPHQSEHYIKETNNIGAPRFRPEHIVASGLESEWPIDQLTAEVRGSDVITVYCSIRSRQCA